MQQLATGNRINQARDDAAGLSIGQNMTSQVRGLNQAVRNVNDGINLLQTADGALVETSNMLQRMRELAVQSSNGTNSVSQRIYLNNEFTSLKIEITRISENTTWNNAPLFGASGPLLPQASQSADYHAFTTAVADAATAAELANTTSLAASNAATTATTMLGLKTAAELAVTNAQTTQTATPNAANLSALNAAIALAVTPTSNSNAAAIASTAATTAATNAANLSTTAAAVGKVDGPLVGSPAYLQGESRPANFIFQAGMSAGQTISVKLDFMDASKLNVASSDVLTFSSAQASVGTIDIAIDTVNASRSAMGATMNQLSYSADNMINISTNIAASRSTVMDTDYATASAQLAKTQIISQAATAMLTQANQQPQSVLALLKG
jgi:flagellin